jgi:NNP family nitrate/nitrite transporter-like MFS transporter
MQTSKAERLQLLRWDIPAMRAFHLAWAAFFVCFFAWFAIAPLMTLVREDLGLSREQVRWSVVASVAATVLARLVVGRMCDRFGPRRTYAWLLALGALPVAGIGLAWNFESFLCCRLLIGVIGASFVVTQYHTSSMFASQCVGTANATAAGWGNLGGGVTQMLMPLAVAFLAGTLGLAEALAWRLAMIGPGVLMLGMAWIYWRFAPEPPALARAELLAVAGERVDGQTEQASLANIARDPRVWLLAWAYAACFGVELTMDNVAHMYFVDYFGLSVSSAGLAAGAFGLMNLFARALGGLVADACGRRWGLRGRTSFMFSALLCEGLALLVFSQLGRIELAIPAMLLAGLFVKMSNGAVYAVVPFIQPRATGMVAGMVGAGGNVGAVAAGMLFGGAASAWPTAFLLLGFVVSVSAFATLGIQPREEGEPVAELPAAPAWSATEGG